MANNFWLKFTIAPLILVLALLGASQAIAGEFFVSPSGNDNKNGRRLSNAWRTLGKANRMLRPGDTVFIDSGSYDGSIQPQRSGSGPSARITYEAMHTGTVTITGFFGLENRSYVSIRGINISATGRYARLQDASHITIEDSVMSGVRGNPGLNMRNTAFSVFRNNIISGTAENYIDVVSLTDSAHHNLFEYNLFELSAHTLVRLGGDSRFDDSDPHHNIFRKNIYNNDYHHCVSVVYGANTNVFEHETFLKCGTGIFGPVATTTAQGVRSAQGEGWHAWQPWGIYRFNVVTHTGSYGLIEEHISAFGGSSIRRPNGRIQRVYGNRIYNNTFVDNYGLVFRLGGQCQENDCTGVQYGDNRFKNNILIAGNPTKSKFGDILISYPHRSFPNADADSWHGNLIGRSSGDVVMWRKNRLNLQEAEAQISQADAEFSNNYFGEPRFRNAQSGDYNLTNNSAAIDSGMPLTYTVTDGTGTVIRVEDARYFIDGFGIVGGDTINIGNQIARITSVNYDRNRLTVDRPVSWQAGVGVSLPFAGNGPDSGAFEFGLRTPVPPILSAEMSF